MIFITAHGFDQKDFLGLKKSLKLLSEEHRREIIIIKGHSEVIYLGNNQAYKYLVLEPNEYVKNQQVRDIARVCLSRATVIIRPIGKKTRSYIYYETPDERRYPRE